MSYQIKKFNINNINADLFYTDICINYGNSLYKFGTGIDGLPNPDAVSIIKKSAKNVIAIKFNTAAYSVHTWFRAYDKTGNEILSLQKSGTIQSNKEHYVSFLEYNVYEYSIECYPVANSGHYRNIYLKEYIKTADIDYSILNTNIKKMQIPLLNGIIQTPIERGILGICNISGSLTLPPEIPDRWHSIYKSNGTGYYRLNTTTGLSNGTMQTWYAICFMDKDRNYLGGVTDYELKTQFVKDYVFEINDDRIAYISIQEAHIDQDTILEYISFNENFIGKAVTKQEMEDYVNKKYKNRKILWLGTSIAEGCMYPNHVCEVLGYTYYNNSIGSSGLIKHSGVLGNGRDCKDLSESTIEKHLRYDSYIGTSQYITQQRIESYGYDKLIIPYINGDIDTCDTVVFDHGYNDRNAELFKTYIDNFDTLDLRIDKNDEDFDRSNFIGAFCFLVKKILEINPLIKIVICSNLENQSGSPEFPNDVRGQCGYYICKLQKKLAEHFNFPFIDMYNYNGFTLENIPNTNTYLTNFNSLYNTSYTVLDFTGKPNPNNNINMFQYYCPDGIHPHTDLSGKSLEIIANSIMKVFKDI